MEWLHYGESKQNLETAVMCKPHLQQFFSNFQQMAQWLAGV